MLTAEMQQKEQSKHGKTTLEQALPHATPTSLSPNGIASANKLILLSTSSVHLVGTPSCLPMPASMAILILTEHR